MPLVIHPVVSVSNHKVIFDGDLDLLDLLLKEDGVRADDYIHTVVASLVEGGS